MNNTIEITKENYRIIDEQYFHCDESMFRYYCNACDEFMGCYFCEFDYTEKHDCSTNQVLSCEICNGTGITNGWIAPDGDYDFEWCECNPDQITPERNF